MSPAARGAAPRRLVHGLVRTLEVLLVAAVGIGGAFGGLRLYDTLQQHPGAARAGSRAPHVAPRQVASATVHATPLRVEAVTPTAGSTGVAPTTAVTVRFSAPLAAGSADPTLSPPEHGTWTRAAPDELVFRPSVPVLPSTTETLRIPGTRRGLRSSAGARLASPVVDHWQVRDGSVLRLQQVLADLGYLPLTWTAAAGAPRGGAADVAAMYHPPTGHFAWRYPSTPAPLQAAWAPGVDNHVTTGAMVSFEVHDGLPGYTSIRPLLWPALLAAEEAHRTNPVGYTYALVSQDLPESLTLWHDGTDVYTSVANTGMASRPTPTGTYFVYRRFQSTTMAGSNPNGSYYVDHGVRWVNYFDGGVAIHGFVRASYGFPQSLGCVELPIAHAAVAWRWIHYGTVVTVLPGPHSTPAT